MSHTRVSGPPAAGWEMMNLLSDPTIVLDADGTVLFLNTAEREHLRLIGVDAAAFEAGASYLVALAAGRALGDADGHAFTEGLRALLRGERPALDLDCHHVIQGEERWFEVRARPCALDGARGVIVQRREVTERRRAGRLLRQDRARLESLSAAACEAVFLHDKRTILAANEAMTRVFGYDRSEVVGMAVDTFIEPGAWNDITRALGSGDQKPVKTTAVRRDGSRLVVELTSRLVAYEGGMAFGVAMHDLTPHEQYEQALRDGEERFRLMSELSSEALVLTERGAIFHTNTAMCRMFGYTHEEMLGMSPLVLTTPEARDAAAERIRSNSPDPYESVGLRKDGSDFPCLVVGRPLPYQGRVIRGTNIQDITVQKRLEEALRQSKEQEIQIRSQASRLNELSTPLIPISDEIVVMPLIGTLDSRRAEQVLAGLLEGIGRTQAHTAILDVTGVTDIDTQVAAHLLRTARAVRLLGAQVLLTGIRPDVAQTLVGLGADLSGIITKGTLQSGIAHVIGRGTDRR